ncbi:LCP family protein [Streptomyces yunnanensis]|uniref:LCP family protein n=1 Tax=Streptomyces yunnanensis TaxID=156453 RepID=A0ABY8A713_9ACTN|nr:LCP family protein [Streptomyces yunnanensis]WEB39551.1 LCP family protein [Streptomyces yunnanensis]
MTAASLATVLALGGWLLYARLDANLATTDVDAALGSDRPTRGPDGSLNILLLGSDSRAGQNAEYGADAGGARSDTAMLVHLAKGRREATVVSIPRDTMVTRPACPLPNGRASRAATATMFNSAYSVGGSACAVKTVEQLGRVRIDHVLDVDFTGFKKLVDAVGGVTVTTDQAIHDRDSHLDLEAGRHRLDGEQALGLVRTRHSIGDSSDLGRIKLQQKFMAALAQQLSGSGLLTDPVRLYQVADAATSALTTDKALGSAQALLGLARSLADLQPSRIAFRTLPVGPYPKDPNRVAVKRPEADALFTAVRDDTALPPVSTKEK